MTKLLWHSNSPWAPTGYGVQSGLFAPMLAQHYDLAVSSFYGLEGAPLNWNGIRVYPGMTPDVGNLTLVGHAKDHFGGDLRGGLVVTLFDVWTLDAALAAQLNMACWVPIDHEPVPPGVADFLQRSNAIPIAMARFGEEQLKLAGFDPLYVPHGVDVDAYKPHDRAEVRKKLNLPEDEFLVGMVAANKGDRKGFQQALEAFRIFRETHDDAKLYLHTVTEPRFAQGVDIMAIAAALGMPEGSIRLADQYRMLNDPFSAQTMGIIMSSLDCLLNPASGEGFGVPVLEAAACGVPAIVTNFSAMPEVAGPAGWPVACRKVWRQSAWQMQADVESILDALERCYGQSQAEADKRSEMCRGHALEYAAPKVLTEHMLPALAEAQRRFEDREPVEASEKVAA